MHVLRVARTALAAPFAYKTYGKAGAYWCLYLGQLFFSLANGTCEAVINPLTASLFPNKKTHWLNILHAGWPGGLVLGALIGLVCNKLKEAGKIEEVGWQIRWGIVVVPILLYGLMMVGRPFPKSEAKLSGVKLRDMMAVVGFLGTAVATALLGLWLSGGVISSLNDTETFKNMQIPAWAGWAVAIAIWLVYGAIEGFSPGHILLTFLYIIHAMVGYVELGTDRWIQDITKSVLVNEDKNISLMAFMWTNILMFTLRFFAGPIVERISPLWPFSFLRRSTGDGRFISPRAASHEYDLALAWRRHRLRHRQNILLADDARRDLRALSERRRAGTRFQRRYWHALGGIARRSGDWLRTGLCRHHVPESRSPGRLRPLQIGRS